MYLSDVEKGGETIFPRIGLEIPPKKVIFLLFSLSLSLSLFLVDTLTCCVGGCNLVV
jgi:hypothetical protein